MRPAGGRPRRLPPGEDGRIWKIMKPVTFINEAEIAATLKSAGQAEPQRVRGVLAKARELQGLDASEVASLMEARDPALLEEIFSAARDELHSLRKSVDDLRDENLPLNAPLRGLQLRQALALAVAPLELEGRILLADGRSDEALALLRKALEREKAIGYSEPPLYPHPMEEVLGRALLDLRRWADAGAMFDAALTRDPGSGRALYGLAKAQEGAGRADLARATLDRFQAAWAHADRDLPEMRAR